MDIQSYKSIVNISGACYDDIKVYSDGMWNLKHGQSILQFSFFRFQVQLISMIAISQGFHFFLKRLDLPRLTSDVLAGIILGPTILGTYFPNVSKLIFPPFPNQVIASLLKIGLVLFTFLTAVRQDVTWIRRTGKRGYILGYLIFAFPFTLTQTLNLNFYKNITMTEPMRSARYQNSVLYLASFVRSQFVDVSTLLMSLKITNSKLGHLALVTTLLGDLFTFVYSNFTLTVQRVMTTSSIKTKLQSLYLIFLFLIFIFVIMRGLTFWFIRVTPEGKPVKDLYLNIVVAAVLLISSVGDNMGVDYLFGPFILGLIVPSGSPLATNLTTKLDTIVYGLLLPLLSTYCGTKLDLWALFDNMDTIYNFQMSLVCYVIKLIATFMIVMVCVKIPFKEAAALSLILNCKGIKEMAGFFSYSPLEERDLDSASGILLVFLLTTYAPPLIKWLYDPSKHYIGYKKKSIQFTPFDSELEILVCVHNQADAMAAMKLLQLSNPTKQTNLSVYGLYLEQLVSSFTPLLIDHQLGQKCSAKSQKIIDAFKFFKLEYKKTAQVSVFTAITPLKLMHEDICFFAFDKRCSLVLLPFHKKWNTNGKIVSNSKELRSLNINILDRAPCSVGILVDRRKTRGLSSIFSSPYRLAVFFLGGEDDREALAYAARMARGNQIERMTVVHFRYGKQVIEDNNWNTILDKESLRNCRQEFETYKNVTFLEETVMDGSETTTIVRAMQDKFDLVLVGRRHENKEQMLSGLSQWSEYPELGVLGDILASKDITAKVSVLIIQQQITKVYNSSTLN